MDILLVSQTVFYIVSSIAIIVVGILIVIVIYYFIAILRNTKNITDDINHTYNKTKKSVKNIINSFNPKKYGNKKK